MIYFLIPVFNEEANIPKLSKTLSGKLPGYDKFFVFVDDGSTDNSIKTIEDYFDKDHSKVLKNKKNFGPGYSFNAGFEWILNESKDSNDRIVTLEGDNTSSTDILSNMITISGLGYDLVLASVYAQGGGLGNTNLFRALISFIANLIIRLVFNIKVLTLSSFYRVYTIDLIRKIKGNCNVIIKEKGFICMVEILIKAIKLKATIIEVPLTLNTQDRKGKSKMRVFKTAISYIRLLLKRNY